MGEANPYSISHQHIVAGSDWVAIEVVETGTFKAAYEYKPGVVIEPTGRSTPATMRSSSRSAKA